MIRIQSVHVCVICVPGLVGEPRISGTRRQQRYNHSHALPTLVGSNRLGPDEDPVVQLVCSGPRQQLLLCRRHSAVPGLQGDPAAPGSANGCGHPDWGISAALFHASPPRLSGRCGRNSPGPGLPVECRLPLGHPAPKGPGTCRAAAPRPQGRAATKVACPAAVASARPACRTKHYTRCLAPSMPCAQDGPRPGAWRSSRSSKGRFACVRPGRRVSRPRGTGSVGDSVGEGVSQTQSLG